MDVVPPGEGARRRPGQLIWFSEETLDVKNPTGQPATRDPKASHQFSGRNARNVRFVPLGIGSDGAIQASSIGAKEAALRTLDEAEGWFYQEEEAPTEGEFLDALRDDVSGVNPRYRAQDINASLDWQEAKKVREFFARRGIDISSKPAELEKQIGLIAEQLDDRGVDADTMASALNAHLGYKAFSSGRDMIEAVSALPKRGDYIKQRVDQIVRGELGDPMDDLPSAASLSMHNIDEEQRILMELQATQEAAGSGATRAINRTAKEYAERRVSKMSVRQIQNPDWALNTERRWAKAATEAMRRGDAAAANKAKFNQLINFHIYKMARAAKAEMERTQLYFKKLQKLSARARITPDYFEQIDALLDQYELRNLSTKEVARRISLSDWVKSMEDRGLGHMVQIDPDIIARSERIPFQQLTVEQARALRDAVKNLDHLGTLKDKLLTAAEQRSFEAVLAELIGAMEATGPVSDKVTRNYSEDDVQKTSARMRRWNAALTRMEFLFRYLDGTHNGKVWRTLFLPFAKAADTESAYQHRVAAQLSNLWDRYSPSERAMMFKTRITIPELAVDSDVTGLNDTFTRMELIAIALNLGNSGNVAALVDGFRWFAAPEGMETDYVEAKRKILAALDQHLTKRDWEFVQETWNIIGQFRDEAFNLHQRLTGLRPEEVQADPIASKHGTFAGGYYPLKFDPLRDAVTERREAKENTPVSNWGVSSLAPMTKKGHLIDRKGSGGRPVRLDFGVATDHIQNVIHDISYREALIDVNRIVSDERFRAAFIRTVGKEQYAQLHPWLHSIAVEYRDPTSDIGKLMQRMRGNMQIVTMGVKIATATQQIAGLLQAVPMLGSAEMAGGVVRMLSNPFMLREKSEYIMNKSEFMRTRVRSFNRDVREFLRRVQDDTAVHKVQRNAFALVGAMDWAVSSIVWITAYEKARAGKVQGIDGGVEEDAVRFADSMVRQTQSAGLNQDLPLIMRNTEMEKLVTAFYSYFSVLYNWTTYDQVLGARKGRVPLYVAAGNFFLIYLLAPMLTEWLAGRWDKEGEDDEEKLQRMLGVIARAPFSSIPIVRDVANTIGSFYDYSLTPFEGGVQAVIDAAADVVDGDILSNERAQKNAAFAIGFVFGLPTAQVYITADYLRDYAEGEEEGLDLTEALLRDTR
jgi:predicted phage tail protein